MKYFDSHSHYYDERFESECDMGVDELIDALLSTSCSGIINVGTSPTTSRLAVEQARKNDKMYTAIGIHPSDSQYLNTSLEEALLDIENIIKSPGSKCVALGEIGLDYHYPDTNRELQMLYFNEQMRLAEHLNLPVSIHDRDAHGDVMDVLRKYKNVRGVLHSFSGSCEMAEELVNMGYMISFSGTLTFTNARRPKQVAAILPKESVMIETDAPYLAPHPNRGKINHSGYLEYTNRTLSEILGITEEEGASLTEKNAKRFFGIND